MHPINIGTCGWSYQDWSGVFYPDGMPQGEFLGSYAERYPTVEVDSTFYRSPSRKMVEGWRDRTPDTFRFSLKVPQVITHEKVLQDCRKELNTFLTAARILENKLCCCVLQFGYFNRTAFGNLEAFLARLDPFLAEWPKDVPVAVEVRNKPWMIERLADCLRAHQAVWVLADQAWMPAPMSLVKKLDTVTGPFAYVRLLGNRTEVDEKTATLDHIVVNRDAEIESDAQAIRLLSERVPVLVYVNNHFAGYAPETINQLQQALAAD